MGELLIWGLDVRVRDLRIGDWEDEGVGCRLERNTRRPDLEQLNLSLFPHCQSLHEVWTKKFNPVEGSDGDEGMKNVIIWEQTGSTLLPSTPQPISTTR